MRGSRLEDRTLTARQPPPDEMADDDEFIGLSSAMKAGLEDMIEPQGSKGRTGVRSPPVERSPLAVAGIPAAPAPSGRPVPLRGETPTPGAPPLASRLL